MANNVTFDVIARDRASATFNKVGQQTETLGTKLKRLAPLAGAIAGAALIKFGKDSVTAFTEAEQAQTKLSDAFARFPALSDTSVGALRRLNEQLALKTRFDDDALASGQAVLAQFKLTGQQVADLTPLVADYAAKTGKELPDAATTLGKAFLGNTRALKELGINYKSTGDQATDVANITALLREQVGGFAEKEGQTAAGQAAILSNQFGEIQESVGAKLIPVLKTLAQVLLEVIAFIQRNSTAVMAAVTAIAALAVTVKAVTLATTLWTTATKLATAATTVWTVAQKALNLAMKANPIGIIITVLIALGAALVAAYKKSETFRNIVQGAWNGIRAAASFVWEQVLRPIFTRMNEAGDRWSARFTAVKDTIGGIWEAIKRAARAAYLWLKRNVFDPISRVVNTIKDAWENLKEAIRDLPVVGNLFGGGGAGGRESAFDMSAAGRVFPLPPGTYRWGRGPAGHGYDAQDLPVPTGTPVRAPVSGYARGIDLGNRSYGKYVQIASSFGRVILAHMSRLLVGSGFVRAGQIIGLSGSTGNSTGPHLHVEPSGILSFAKGGIIPEHVIGVGTRSGRPYQFGEGGVETVIPGRVNGGGLTVNVYAGVGDPKAIGREVVQAVGTYLKAGGTLPPKWHTA